MLNIYMTLYMAYNLFVMAQEVKAQYDCYKNHYENLKYCVQGASYLLGFLSNNATTESTECNAQTDDTDQWVLVELDNNNYTGE